MKKWITIIFFLSIHSSPLMSQGFEETPYLSLTLENYLFSFPGGTTNRYYTNGARIDYFF